MKGPYSLMTNMDANFAVRLSKRESTNGICGNMPPTLLRCCWAYDRCPHGDVDS